MHLGTGDPRNRTGCLGSDISEHMQYVEGYFHDLDDDTYTWSSMLYAVIWVSPADLSPRRTTAVSVR